ncbi:MAG: 3-dehydroquinate synthase [Bacteroidales bacterium]|nr:3-dehydroquinate synthase [Bacteroidales bacterium]
MMKKEIEICSGTGIISRVVFGDVGSGMPDCALAECLAPYPEVFAVIDANLTDKSSAAGSVYAMLKERNVPSYAVEASEQAKNMETVLGICSWLMDCNAGRDALVLAIGGGITTDMTGFAASVYKRGVRFAYVPTTLLAQVDASVGGKTGVNFEQYKNMLGVIRQPEFTYADIRMLGSLPYRDFLSGAAEMLKTFIIEDNGNYAASAGVLKELHSAAVQLCRSGECEFRKMTLSDVMVKAAVEWDVLANLVAESIKVKAGIVSRDQFEGGERRKLNLGHTFAHAIETLARRQGDDLKHGEAVAIGIVMAARLAGLCPDIDPSYDCALAARLEADFTACGLPVRCPYDILGMAEVMSKDKKSVGGKVHFVLPCAVGDVRIVDLSATEACAMLNDCKM